MKKIVKISETQLRNAIAKGVKKMLNEVGEVQGYQTPFNQKTTAEPRNQSYNNITPSVNGSSNVDPATEIANLDKIAQSNYAQALQLLKDAAAKVTPQNNVQFRQALAREAQEMGVGKVTVQRDQLIDITNLLPTQNEIGIGVTVKYSIYGNGDGNGSGAKCKAYFEGKGGWDSNGQQAPILVTNGNLIIDGHHRWSQVKLINPTGKILADIISFGGSNDANKTLTLSQMGILDANLANGKTEIPSTGALGENLLTEKGSAVERYIQQMGGLPGNGKVPGDFIQVMYPLMIGNGGQQISNITGQQGSTSTSANPQQTPLQEDVIPTQTQASPNIQQMEQALTLKLIENGNAFPNPPAGSTKRDAMPQFDQAAGGQNGALQQMTGHLGTINAKQPMQENRKHVFRISESDICALVMESVRRIVRKHNIK